MFKELGQITSMMKNLQGLGGRVQEMKERLSTVRCFGTAGDGLVQIEMDGTSRTLGCVIAPELLAAGDSVRLQNLVVEAIQDGQAKVREAAAEEMKSITGGEAMPGLMKMLGIGG